MVQYSQIDSKLVLYRPILAEYLNGQSGDLWRWMDKRADKVVRGAKRQVGVQTGRLRRSIHSRHSKSLTGQELMIGSDISYGYMHHEGTRPHIIAPKNGGVLVLRSGHVVRGAVRHPGTKPNRFLSDQLIHFRV
jgi:hypothetical protein